MPVEAKIEEDVIRVPIKSPVELKGPDETAL